MTRGQTSIEVSIVMILMVIVGLGGASLVLNQFGKILLTRWAAKNARCHAEALKSDNTEIRNTCDLRTKNELQKYFAFREVDVSERLMYGVIHTKIKGKFVGRHIIQANFDLEPSEYKRVEQ